MLSILSAQSSDTRMPVAISNSSTAWSRSSNSAPVDVVAEAPVRSGSNMRRNSRGPMVRGNSRGWRILMSRSSKGLALIKPSRRIQVDHARRDASFLRTVLAACRPLR